MVRTCCDASNWNLACIPPTIERRKQSSGPVDSRVALIWGFVSVYGIALNKEERHGFH